MLETWVNSNTLGAAFAALALVGGLFVVCVRQTRGWGPRNIQALGLALVIPTLIFLASTGVLSGEVVAALIGGIIGYALRGHDPDRERGSSGDRASGNDPKGDAAQGRTGT